MKFISIYPKQGQEYDHPKEWDEKIIETDDEIYFIKSRHWGNRIGNEIYFIKSDNSTYWHFCSNTISYPNIKLPR